MILSLGIVVVIFSLLVGFATLVNALIGRIWGDEAEKVELTGHGDQEDRFLHSTVESRGEIMKHIARIGDYITVSDCSTAGTVKAIKAGLSEATGLDHMLVYEIETEQGLMRIPADWLERLLMPVM